jgi:hypothetical protein
VVDPPARSVSARLADDGRYHLCVGAKPVCAERKVRGIPRSYRHRQDCRWWYLDGSRRFGNSYPPEAEAYAVPVAWIVELTDEQVPADSVSPHLRCPVMVDSLWPRFLGGSTPIARIRAHLIEVFGPPCATCRRAGQYVDHDHDSGLVRGLLCEICNVMVDSCPHLGGCAFAEYLTQPPALSLAIPYPDRGRGPRRPMPGPAERAARRAEVAALRAEGAAMRAERSPQ